MGLQRLHPGPGSLLLLHLLTGRGSERDPEICAREAGGAHARPLSGGVLRLWNTASTNRANIHFHRGSAGRSRCWRWDWAGLERSGAPSHGRLCHHRHRCCCLPLPATAERGWGEGGREDLKVPREMKLKGRCSCQPRPARSCTSWSPSTSSSGTPTPPGPPGAPWPSRPMGTRRLRPGCPLAPPPVGGRPSALGP